jgi:hypothetical protein
MFFVAVALNGRDACCKKMVVSKYQTLSKTQRWQGTHRINLSRSDGARRASGGTHTTKSRTT